MNIPCFLISHYFLEFGLSLATVHCLSVSSLIGMREEQLNWLLGCKVCRSVQLLPGKNTLKTQPLDSHLFLKNSGDKALPERIAANSSFTHHKIISIIIALNGQKLRKTNGDFCWKFKTGGSQCPCLHSPLLSPQVFFFVSMGFLSPGPW